MAKVKLTKEEVAKMMKVEGNISGSVFKSFYQFLVDKRGKGGRKRS